MAEKKIIAIMGGTGAQGGGLARAILKDPKSEFSARIVTRDENSAKAREFRDKGAEVVSADVDDPESLKKAFKGAYGAFCVTFYWAHMDPEKETAQAKNLADAAKADKYFKDSGLPVTFLVASFYWENFIFFGSGPKRTPEGKTAFILPMGDKKLAGIAAEDIGKCAYGIFKNKARYVGKYVGLASDHLTINEIAEKLSRELGQDVGYVDIPPDVLRGFGFPGADDVGNMFQFYRDFEGSRWSDPVPAGTASFLPLF